MGIPSNKSVSTTINNSLWVEAKNYNIAWSKALELGIKLLLYDEDPEYFYPPECKLKDNIDKLQEHINQTNEYIEELKLKIKNLEYGREK